MTIPNRQHLIDKIKSYGNLCDGWDGYDSVPPSDSHIMAVIGFVSKIPDDFDSPSSMISPNGMIGLYWSNHQLYADIEFEDDDRNISDELISVYIRSRINDSETYIDNVIWKDCDADWFNLSFGDYFKED